MALVIGAEISLKPLLIRSLQRLLYYTSFPAGFICLDADPSVSHPGEWTETRIDAAVGDYRLVDLIGQSVRLPADLLGPGAAVGRNATDLLTSLPVKPGHYSSYLRLPIDGKGVIVLLAPQLPETELPLTQMFKPVMAHLARAIVLCRSYDAYTGGLIAERDRLADQQRLAAKMFESSNSSIVITDPEGTILSVNAAFSRITGYAPDDALGQNPRLLSSGRHDRDFFRQMWHDISTKDRWIGEVWNRRQSGELFPVWLMISAVRDPAGKLTNYMGIFTDISEQKAAEAHIEYLGSHDPLTGLPNRMLLRDRTGNAIVHATRERQKLAMLYVDIDNFNTVNDSLGHGVGDDLLRMTSERLQACVRDIDTVSRLGADEFLIVLNELNDGEMAAHIADKILKALAEPMPCGEHRLDASSTIGISLFPDDGDDFDTLLKHADTALRDAKLNDRGNYRFFTDAMNAGVRERFALENRLRGAVERGEFVLHYQPQVDFASRRVIGAEALIRWNNPEMGLVSPARFIPVAERSGAIVSIGAWVVFEACRQLAEWRAAGLPEMSMAVNLSAVQFKRGQLVETVREALADYGLPAACLELELTESILIHDTEQTLEIVRSLKALGVRLSLDDFGTGYSSFSYLTRFAVDKLKIDQSFVRDMVNSQEAAKIVRAIVELGRSLGLETIAEGIETAEQSTILHDYGCDQAQGYYFSRPLPASDFPLVIDAAGLIRIA
jgi:diguanylate cyclase (GGDEF)-like protein/PAS domain S-box-containing protein